MKKMWKPIAMAAAGFILGKIVDSLFGISAKITSTVK